jgi:hypothetical protein
MTVAYVLLNYEIEFPKEYDGKRPDVTRKGEVLMPPKDATISVVDALMLLMMVDFFSIREEY